MSIRTLFTRHAEARHLAEELRQHIEERTAELMQTGMTRSGAASAARRELGNVTGLEERGREIWGWTGLDALASDLRYAVRQIRRSPAFSAAVILTIALGAGANTAIFSVIDAVLLRPLPYKDPHQLMFLWEGEATQSSLYSFSYPRFAAFRDQLTTFSGLAAYDDEQITYSNRGVPESIEGGRVTRDFFSILQVKPLLGRTFSDSEDVPGGPPVAMLSNYTWMKRYQSDPAIVGKAIPIDNQPHTIIGVLPAGFQFLGEPVEVWRPRIFDTGTFAPASVRLGARYLTIVGRLRPGVSLRQAQAEIAVVDRNYQRQQPGNSDIGLATHGDLLASQIFGGLRLSLKVLWGAVSCLLLIACANVANLLLSRAWSRRQEIGARLALGASRARIAQQLLAESVVLSLCGGVVALPLAYYSVDSLVSLIRQSTPQVPDVHLNPIALAFTLLLCVTAGIAFGLAPVALCTTGQFGSMTGRDRAGTESRQTQRWRSALISCEIALAIVLLAGAGLLLRSFQAMRAMPTGLRTARVITMPLRLMPDRYEPWPARTAFYDEILRRVRDLPSVESAGVTSRVDLMQPGLGYHAVAEGAPDGVYGARGRSISTDYLDLLGIPLVEGRGFTRHDTAQSARVMLVNQTFARRYFPGQSAIGKRVTYSTDRITCQIVGVVRDVRSSLRSMQSNDEIYLPLAQRPWLTARLVVRTRGDTASSVTAIRREVQSIDPEQAVLGIRTLEQNLEGAFNEPRTMVTVLGGFALTALALAAVGIYGLLAYTVAQRSREIAVRMALGAQPARVLQGVLRHSLGIALWGVAVGLPASIALGHAYSSLLFRVSPEDPMTAIAILLGLTAVVLIASYLPARRASRVDPAALLRG